MFKKLANKRGSKEYEEWFLKYVPSQMKKTEQTEKKKKVEKYVEEDEHVIAQKDMNSQYGEESNPNSLISKYRTKKSKKSEKSKKSNMIFNDEFDNPSGDNKKIFNKKGKSSKSKYQEHNDILTAKSALGESDIQKEFNDNNKIMVG